LAKQHIALVDVLIKRTQDGPLIAKLQGVVAIPAWGWWIGTGFFCDDISAAYWRLARTLMAIAVAIFIAVGTMAWFMTRSVTRALGGDRPMRPRSPHKSRPATLQRTFASRRLIDRACCMRSAKCA
jgi:hypothetical protein